MERGALGGVPPLRIPPSIPEPIKLCTPSPESRGGGRVRWTHALVHSQRLARHTLRALYRALCHKVPAVYDHLTAARPPPYHRLAIAAVLTRAPRSYRAGAKCAGASGEAGCNQARRARADARACPEPIRCPSSAH